MIDGVRLNLGLLTSLAAVLTACKSSPRIDYRSADPVADARLAMIDSGHFHLLAVKVWRLSNHASGPRGWWQLLLRALRGRLERESGYAVNALEAVTILATKDPDAATWWREHCGHALDGKRRFLFRSDVCQQC